MKSKICIAITIIALIPFPIVSGAETKSDPDSECQSPGYYSFSWPINHDCDFKPRGGTSKGAHVELADQPRKEWKALQETGLSKFERDRKAILAMSGGYRVDFDFLETVGFSSDYQRDKPYQSWGTEYVYVVEDQPAFISLQHVMVMYFEQEDGSISEPMVMKHWRQDWTYEDQSMLEFSHNNQWQKRTLSKEASKGKWTQAVFQVDDSPRYESIGEWEHNASFSSWKSSKTRRPLPRREFSVRQDYNVLEGFNTHTVTRHGWVQVEENWKMVVDENGLPDSTQPYLSKEQGLARYQPTSNVDYGPGDEYMALAGQFWGDVRTEWKRVFAANQNIALNKSVDGQPLFMPLFGYGQEVMEQGSYDSKAGRAFAAQKIAEYLQ